MGINARVMDPFTIKPLDVAAVLKNANACGGRVIVVEDHYYAGKVDIYCFRKHLLSQLEYVYYNILNL